MTRLGAILAIAAWYAASLPLYSQESEPAAEASGAAEERRRQEDLAILAPAKARKLELSSGADKAELHKEPLLRWSNPTAGSVYGEVYLWTIEGRPAALASIYRWYHPFTDATVEFASVWDRPISAGDAGAVVWNSQTPGVAFKPLENVRAPSSSAASRLAQMKSIARKFSAQLLDERGGEPVERQLRLLNQPVHRYAAEKHGIVDGALFAFVEGTDPEAWLLVEAAKGPNELAWRYALARMNVDALEIRREETIVQSWDNIFQSWTNRMAPYTLFSFDPKLVETPQETP